MWINNVNQVLNKVLARKSTILSYLPPCTTYLCQAVETFVIAKIKDVQTTQ